MVAASWLLVIWVFGYVDIGIWLLAIGIRLCGHCRFVIGYLGVWVFVYWDLVIGHLGVW